MSKDNGGQAFPTVDYAKPVGGGAHMMTITGGMTLRDYFAAKAMQGIISGGGLGFMGWHPSNWDSSNGLVKSSYEIADAMLAESAK